MTGRVSIATTMFLLTSVLITIAPSSLTPWGWSADTLPISVLLTIGVTIVITHSLMRLLLWGSSHQSRA